MLITPLNNYVTNYNKCVSKLPLEYLLLNIIIYAQLYKKNCHYCALYLSLK